ncbi:MAG: CRISPR-associated ring nuclease [Candidatus Micrarchaeaceae archaeon]
MVVSEVFRYIRNTDEKLKHVTLIYTKDSEVSAGVNAVIGAIGYRYGDVKFHRHETEIDDISDQKSLEKFLDDFADVMNIQKSYDKNIYLNVTGGRKIQGIAMAIYGSFAGIKEIYNVIHTDVKNYNEHFERVKNYIIDNFSGMIKDDEAISRYEMYKDKLDPVFFPDPKKLVMLKIPLITLPRSEVENIRRVIDGISLEDGSIEDFRIDSYVESGFITKDRRMTYPTELGRIVRKMIQ